ncbi:FtsW/RodA/SpoVE family cell cycle protein [candidate division KSB1 bacterium]
MKRYHFRKSDPSVGSDSSKYFLFPALFLPAGGLFLVHIGLRFSYNVSLITLLFPVLILLLLIGCVAAVLLQSGYRGSYLPLAAMILLMGIGTLVQIRMHAAPMNIETSKPSAEIVRVETGTGENDAENSGTAFRIHGMRTQLISYVSALVALTVIVLYVSGRKFDWIGEKYVLVFILCIAGLTLMVVIARVLGSGKFLYSRTPWEPLKIVLPLSLAGFFAYNGRFFRIYDRNKFNFSIAVWGPFFIMCFLPLLLFMALGDLGQVMIYSIVMLALLYIASGSVIYPVIGLTLIIMLSQMASFTAHYLPDYVAGRIELWQHFWAGFPSPEWWDRSYQTANALFAIQAGGVSGSGLGLGHPDLVPLSVSDFVFVEIAEELGFIGSFAIILLYLCIILFGIHTAFQCSRQFDHIAISALSLLFGIQVFINIGGVINIIPLTGIVLPFISKGGFSVVTFGSLVGLIMAASHRNKVESLSSSEKGSVYV